MPKTNHTNELKLTSREEKFCREYIIDFNGAGAATRAGYSKKAAKEQASYLLTKTNVQQFIQNLKQNSANKLEITHERITAEFAKIAFSSIAHLHNTWIDRKTFEELKENNPDILDCIQEIQTRVKKVNIGEGEIAELEEIKLKLYDKQRALDSLGKHVGYFEKDNEQKGNITLSNDVQILLKKYLSLND